MGVTTGAGVTAPRGTGTAKGAPDKDDPPILPPSHVIKDVSTHKRYRIGKLLGKGGFAFCYEGVVEEGASAGERVAVKVIPKHRLRQQRHLDKVHREIRLHASVKHPHIVRLFSSFEDPNNIYILLEVCQLSLVEVVKSRGKVTEIEAAYYIRQILLALDYLHSPGVDILHRDVKLGNVLLSEQMQVKLADFGLASEMEPETRRPATISVCGTPNYISPELLEKQGHSIASEMWAVGCTLYACLVGRPPFETSSIEETYQLIRAAQFVLPATLSAHAKDLIQRLLALRPSQRPTPADALRHPFLCANPLPHSLLLAHTQRPILEWEYKELIAQTQQALPSPMGQANPIFYSPTPPPTHLIPTKPPTSLKSQAQHRVVWAPPPFTSSRKSSGAEMGGAPVATIPSTSVLHPLQMSPGGYPQVKPRSNPSSAERMATLSLAPLAKMESAASLAQEEQQQQPPPLPPRLSSTPGQRQSYQAALGDPILRYSPTQGLGNGLRSSPPPLPFKPLPPKPPVEVPVSLPVPAPGPIRRPIPPSPPPVKTRLGQGLPQCLRAYLQHIQMLIGRVSSRRTELASKMSFIPVQAESMEIGGRRVRCVQRWIDYTNKYGFGVQLSDGSTSVAFLDGSRLSLVMGSGEMQLVEEEALVAVLEGDPSSVAAKENTPRYRLSRGDSGLGSSEELTGAAARGSASFLLPAPLHPTVWPVKGPRAALPKDLAQKMEWLGLFQHYMKGLVTGEAAKSMETGEGGGGGGVEEASFLLHWHRLPNCVLLLLSDGTLQINFLEDHRKLTFKATADELGVIFADGSGNRLGALVSPIVAEESAAAQSGLAMDVAWRKALRDANRLIHDHLKIVTA